MTVFGQQTDHGRNEVPGDVASGTASEYNLQAALTSLFSQPPHESPDLKIRRPGEPDVPVIPPVSVEAKIPEEELGLKMTILSGSPLPPVW
ncbi:MAG: hypothetical protein HGB17_08255 [Syntrophobacteraceae bacterium]|nr:hypothetical protein [Syntrophobacteraceae bacterium]